MRKGICMILLIMVVVWPNLVLAAECLLNINVMRQEDGTTCGELLFNNQVVWRLAVLADGAKPVAGFYSIKTTFISPDIENGLFLIKVQ